MKMHTCIIIPLSFNNFKINQLLKQRLAVSSKMILNKNYYCHVHTMIIFIHQIGRDKNTNKLKQTTIVQRMKRCKLHMHQ